MKIHDPEVWETEMGLISKHVVELLPFDGSWHKQTRNYKWNVV